VKWFQIFKNIQISSQKTNSRDYVKPDEPEDCLEWFKQLYYLVQGDKIVEREMNIEPFKEYTNEKLWCPLKNGIKLNKQPSKFEKGVISFIFESQVILSGERVNFKLSVDVPEANTQLKDLPDTTFYIVYEMTSTSNRIDVLFFQAAHTGTDYTGLRWEYAGPPEMQMKKYQEISRKIMLYMKEALG